MTAAVPIEAGIALLSGTMFDYDNPGAAPVVLDDIATALSNVCRFAGHVSHFYSVAQHAVNCSYIVPAEHAFDALMHDTAEAFTNDITTPLKFRVPIFKVLEQRIEGALAEQYGFAYPLPDPVKLADLQMLILENQALRRGCPLSGIDEDAVDLTGLGVRVDLSSWTPDEAKARFLARFAELTGASVDWSSVNSGRPLSLDDYQQAAIGTAVYPGRGGALGLSYVALKMNGEAGEFAEHLGKAIRDDGFGSEAEDLTPERRLLLKKELGDVLWYVAAGAGELGFSLEEIAQENLDKLASRKARGVLSGSGDNR